MASRHPTSNLLLIAAAGLAVYYFRNTAKQNAYVSGMNAFIQDVKINKGHILVTFKFQNSNSAPAVIRSVVGTLFLNGNKLAAVSSFSTVEIKGNAETQYTVDVVLKLSTVINSIAELVKGYANASLNFQGHVNWNNRSQPVNLTFSFK